MRLEDSKEFIGLKFNHLTITGDAGRAAKFRKVYATCDCGKSGIYALVRLRSGNTKSCGCIKKPAMLRAVKAITTHGMCNHPLFKVWMGIKNRCADKKNLNYGGRGISICNEWVSSFIAFYNWAILNGWEDVLEVDRINVNGNYEPSNCRFVTPKQNSRNKRNSFMLTVDNQTRCLQEWSELVGLSGATISYRIKKLKWSPEQALKTPLLKKYAIRVPKSL